MFHFEQVFCFAQVFGVSRAMGKGLERVAMIHRYGMRAFFEYLRSELSCTFALNSQR